MTGRLAGKVALITGTAGGQGRAAAVRFAQEGARIVGCDLKTAEDAQTVAMVRDAGGDMISLAPLDLTSETAVRSWIDLAVSAFGDFDILYNNASAPKFGLVEEMPLTDWHFTLENELTLLFLTIKHAVPVLARRGGGCIVNTASVSGLGADWPMAAYNAAKGGVVNLTRSLAMDFAERGVRVNAVCPSLTRTGMTEEMLA